jgi:hypothetical protein
MTIHAQPVADPRARLEPNALLLEVLLGEARSTATGEQERGFLLATGQRIADGFPLTGLVELAALESAMNEVWQMLDLGNVHLSVGKDGIGIEHRRSAHRSALAQPQWDNAEPVVLEGVYGRWFGVLGNDRLSLKRIGGSYDTTSFHYGR